MTDHLSPEELLLFLDGELPKRHRSAAELHIRSCWSCTTGLERLKADIGLIVDAHDQVVSPAVPPPPSPWLPVQALASAASKRRRGFWSRRFFRRRTVWTTSALAAAALAIFMVWVAPTPASAKAVFRRLVENDQKLMSASSGNFIRQRVRVVRTRRRTHEISSGVVDSWQSVTGSYWKITKGDSAASGLEAHYQTRNFQALPLSPVVYQAWSEDAGGEGIVSSSAGSVEVSFAANSEGDLRRLRLSTLPAAWHVNRMELGFRDDDFDVRELELAVVSKREAPPDVLSHLEPVASGTEGPAESPNAPALPPDRTPAKISAPDRNAPEIDVYFALHQAGADLGEPVDVAQLPSGRISVRIWGITPERREFLSQLLQGMPDVDIEKEPLGQQTALTIPSPPSSMASTGPPPSATDGTRAADERRLLEWFGNAQLQEDFTRSVLANTTELLSHLYALKKLAARWPSEQWIALPEISRAKLIAMVEDHARAADLRCSELRFLLKPLLDAFSPDAESETPAQTFPDWQSSSTKSLDAAKSLDRFLRSVLTTDDSPQVLESALPMVRQDLYETSSAINALLVSTK